TRRSLPPVPVAAVERLRPRRSCLVVHLAIGVASRYRRASSRARSATLTAGLGAARSGTPLLGPLATLALASPAPALLETQGRTTAAESRPQQTLIACPRPVPCERSHRRQTAAH